ncbi:protein unc-93 homolog A [Macrosteles quadrilineatus]|uniref:protein unc-93 homolog A n=1 Tax=Macrosteles quadrilineatus TaxID=74068 RepID=UPI0023E0BA34|nr:protein unc-93 homolog A [Macrosteles quadrilineatus]
MGSLPNLHSLSSWSDIQALYSPLPKGRRARNPSPVRPRGRVSMMDFGHRPVKHVRSVDRSIYHALDKRVLDHGDLSKIKDKLLDRKLPLVCPTSTVVAAAAPSQRVIGITALTHRPSNFESAMTNSYSPVSSRSTITHHHFHGLHHQSNVVRHRESLSSSAGASSVRRLIGVVRSTPSQFGPVYSRRVIHKNWAALCLANALLTSAIVPLLGLQSSISSWWWPPGSKPEISPNWFYLSADIGSLLLASLFAIGSLSSLFIVAVIKKLGTNTTINISYGCAFLFFSSHLYPKLYTLIPSYIIMGISLGPMAGAKVTALMALASKYSFVLSDEEEDEIERVEETSRRDAVIHKLARWMQTTQDCGLVLGNLLTGMVMAYTWSIAQDVHDTHVAIDSMYAIDDVGERVCGANACPVTLDFHRLIPPPEIAANRSDDTSLILPCKSCMFLASVFIGFGIMAWIVAAVFTDRIIIYQDISEKSDFAKSYKVMADTFKDPHLQLMVPLALYIGLTQGFMYADFTKSYVVCSLDVYNITWVFVALGVLQCIAGCTVSLVLQQIKRIYVISVGFTFHSCLILVLLKWKPTGDDPALFYVIGAVWGVCNSIWECLTFSLLIVIHPDTWQPAIGHHYFFRYLGLALAFSIHGAFCNQLKLYILAMVLILTAISYSILEWKLSQRPKDNLDAL